MALNDIYKLAVIADMTGNLVVMTMFFREEVIGIAGDQRAVLANDFVGQVIAPAANSLRSITTNNLGYNVVTVQRVHPAEQSTYQHLITPGLQGTKVSPYLPPCVAVCVTWNTERGGRRGRGRTYLPPGAAADHLNGSWISTHINAVNATMSTISNRYAQQSGWQVSGFRLGVWSRVIAYGVPPLPNSAFSPVNGWVARPEVRCLTRRSRVKM